MNSRSKIRNLPIYNNEQFGKLSLSEKLKYICLLGHLAPSTHNTQAWRFKINSDQLEIQVFIDKNMVLPESDKSGRQTAISIGCCLQNMIEGLNFFSWDFELVFRSIKKQEIFSNSKLNKNKELVEVAKFKLNEFVKNKIGSEVVFLQEIFQRKVMRAEFDSKHEVPQKMLKAIGLFCAEKRMDCKFIQKGIIKNSIAEFQGQADNFVINSKDFSKELGVWLLPNNTKSFVGMPGVGFGLNNLQAERLHMSLLGKKALEPEDGLKFSTMGKIFLEKSPLVIALFSKKDEVEDWISSGMLLEKILLFLEKNGFSVAIHAAIVEVGLVNKIFSATLGTTKRLMALFRVGKVKNYEDLERPFSPRLPIESVIIE